MSYRFIIDNRNCINCKTCMQACPYDAIYLDPDIGTAQKCNSCAHRVEAGLEPSCVNACPAHAIISGDLDDRQSEMSRLLAAHPVQVSKPSYIEGERLIENGYL